MVAEPRFEEAVSRVEHRLENVYAEMLQGIGDRGSVDRGIPLFSPARKRLAESRAKVSRGFLLKELFKGPDALATEVLDDMTKRFVELLSGSGGTVVTAGRTQEDYLSVPASLKRYDPRYGDYVLMCMSPYTAVVAAISIATKYQKHLEQAGHNSNGCIIIVYPVVVRDNVKETKGSMLTINSDSLAKFLSGEVVESNGLLAFRHMVSTSDPDKMIDSVEKLKQDRKLVNGLVKSDFDRESIGFASALPCSAPRLADAFSVSIENGEVKFNSYTLCATASGLVFPFSKCRHCRDVIDWMRLFVD